MQTANNGVRAQGLGKSFDHVQALNGIDLDIRPGEIFGLVGPDGAGKTTLFRLLCGAMEIDTGEARVGPFNVRTEPESVKRIIGYMSQKFSLYGDLTVAENIHFVANLFHVEKSDKETRETQLLAASRMEPFRKRLARDLSGGMKQKLALTCTLIHRPRILFLDEPTTGVDPVSRRDFWKILYQLVREGITLVVSTPYMDEAERCNRIAFIHHGKVLCCASPRELKAKKDGHLHEINVRPAMEARKVLSELPQIQGVHVFGSKLHVRAANLEVIEQIVPQALEKAGIEYFGGQEIHPNLEDVFISLATQGDLHDSTAAK